MSRVRLYSGNQKKGMSRSVLKKGQAQFCFPEKEERGRVKGQTQFSPALAIDVQNARTITCRLVTKLKLELP